MESIIDNAQTDEKSTENLDEMKDAKIIVVGVGGAGNNQVTRIQKKEVEGAETVAINTDKQHLEMSSADRKILVGKDLTRGLGAGGKPEKGARSAEENLAELRNLFKDAHMVFLTAGMVGGTGTGAAPVLAEIAKKEDCIVIGTVTMPFEIEGARMSKAEDGLYRLRQHVDTAIVIENDKLLDIAGDMPLDQAFGVADELITTMIKGITETIAKPSLVNLDYADVQAIMNEGGVAVVGYGESDTNNKGEEAIHEALSNPLLDVEFSGANGALLHVAGGEDLTLNEINSVGQRVKQKLDKQAQVIWGARIKDDLKGKLQVISIVTGVESPYVLGDLEDEDQSETEVTGDVNDLGLEVMK